MGKFKKDCFLWGAVFLIFFTSSSSPEDLPPCHAPNTLPGVEPGMLTPEYWISLQNDPDRVIMTSEEIVRFNEKIRKKKVVFRDLYGKPNPLKNPITKLMGDNLFMNPLLPLDIPGIFPGESLRVWLECNIEQLYHPGKLWGSRGYYDNRNVIYNDDMKNEIVDDMNFDCIPDVITSRFGIIVNRADMRYFPTPVPGYNDTITRTDRFQGGALYTGMPVAVHHESVDGDYLFVISPVSRGWVAACDVAMGDRKKIRKLTEDTHFLMATTEKVPVYGNPSYRNFTRYLYFSATLPLIKHDNEGYTVKMPYRKPDGSCGVADGYIKPDADVHIGYLPYTKRNVLNQIFKLLNQPYGWEDMDNKRDCCGTMWTLLRCFGIKTGRVPRYILNASENIVYIDPGLSSEEKMSKVANIEPVTTMAGASGHIVLYLGKAHNGKLYFMHQAGWGYKDNNGNHLVVNRLSINAADHSWYGINSPKVFTTFDDRGF